MKFNKYNSLLFIAALLVTAGSCKKFIDPGSPETGLIKETVFQSDATANGAVLGIYNLIFSNGFSQDFMGIGANAAMYTDELRSYATGTGVREVYTNSVNPLSGYPRNIWQNIYSVIFQVNSAIEGLSAGEGVTEETRKRLLAETNFLRAFLYFNLVNLYGDVPLILSTDYEVSRLQPRTDIDTVYNLILHDLQAAEDIAAEEYVGGAGTASSETIRVNKSVIEAFKARVLLYRRDYTAAEEYASRVIEKDNLFKLDNDLNNVFLPGSEEAIWQLKPSNSTSTMEGYYYLLVGAASSGLQKSNTLSADLFNLFEDEDKRKLAWIAENVVEGTSYHYPYKYKSAFDAPNSTEYLMVLRLAEMYLIRAEARAEQDNLTGANSAVSDLQKIRDRAGLTNPITASSYTEIIQLVEDERRRELFTEWGHRFFDLKRLKAFNDPGKNRIDEVMPAISAAKGGEWQEFEKLFPIPQTERLKAPNLSQNDGYN